MTLSHRFWLAGLLALAGGAAEPTGESSPEQLLKERGLTRAGTCFVVASETGVITNFNSKVRPAIVHMSQAHAKYARVLENEMMLEQALEYKDNLVSEVASVRLALPNMPQRNDVEKAQKAQAQRYLNELFGEQNRTASTISTLRARKVPVAEKVRLEKEFEKQRTAFLEEAGELRTLFDKTMGEYQKHQEDDSVKNALNAYRRLTKANLPLGPSKDFVKAIKTVKEAERSYSPETAAPKAPKKKKSLKR